MELSNEQNDFIEIALTADTPTAKARWVLMYAHF